LRTTAVLASEPPKACAGINIFVTDQGNDPFEWVFAHLHPRELKRPQCRVPQHAGA
jgi:hypothetical protein